MPKVDGVGYGDLTEIKLSHFKKIMAMHLAITQSVLNKNFTHKKVYHYLELTAGKGFTPDGKKGSPIAFLEEVEADNIKIPYQADFIECEPKNIQELEKILEKERRINSWKGNNWNFHCCRYEKKIPELFPNKALEFGLVFVDHSGDLPNFDILNYIAQMRPKMEILIYLPSTNIKRTYQYTEKKLIDHLGSIEKKHWLIRKPKDWDKFKWTFLLGSNAQNLFRGYKSIDFYSLESKPGQSILEKLNLTEKEQIESKQYSLKLKL
jgi:three-Cys-motif partner protein